MGMDSNTVGQPGKVNGFQVEYAWVKWFQSPLIDEAMPRPARSLGVSLPK